MPRHRGVPRVRAIPRYQGIPRYRGMASNWLLPQNYRFMEWGRLSDLGNSVLGAAGQFRAISWWVGAVGVGRQGGGGCFQTPNPKPLRPNPHPHYPHCEQRIAQRLQAPKCPNLKDSPQLHEPQWRLPTGECTVPSGECTLPSGDSPVGVYVHSPAGTPH
jgi:hypothetical protein